MMFIATVWWLATTTAAFIPASGTQGVTQEAKPTAGSFLQKAAEGQHVAIALGQLASERAENQQVKQFGSRMIMDHRKASAEIQQLASMEGVVLPTEMTGRHKDKHDQFGRLSGKDFDKAYIGYMLRDHRKDVKEFERNVKAIDDLQVQQWAQGTLPLLKQHLRHAQRIANAIGMDSSGGQ